MQAWQEHGFAFEWAKEAGLDVRGLRFARDVHRQLDGITGPSGSHLLGNSTSPQPTGQFARPVFGLCEVWCLGPEKLKSPHADQSGSDGLTPVGVPHICCSCSLVASLCCKWL